MYSKLKSFITENKNAGPIAHLLIAWLFVAGLFFATRDEGAVIAVRWLLVTFVLAFVMRPLLPIDKLDAWDDCFGLSFGFSLGISFLLTFIICSITGLSFATPVCFVVTMILCVISVVLASCKKGFYIFDSEGLCKTLKGFVVFSVLFLIFFWTIGFKPSLDSSTEKFMDYGFMTTIFRQESIKPIDLWFAGEKLNYYYLGHASAVFMTRLSLTTPEYGYNLMLCSFISVVFTGAFEIANGFVKNIVKPNSQTAPKLAGVFAGCMAAFSANFVWIIRGIILPIWRKITKRGLGEKHFWFADPTVYISTSLGDPDNGKNEFPAYSVILGDLHAHVLDVIFTLPFLAIMIDYLFCDKENESKIIYRFSILGCLLALYKGSNYWDFAIFYVICGGMVVFKTFAGGGFMRDNVLGVLKSALVVTLVSFLAALPFTLSFDPISSEVFFCKVHTPMVKMLVLWGFPILVTLVLLLLLVHRENPIIEDKRVNMGFIAFMLCTIGLIIVPEIVYVKDIYTEENLRFNTMFKLTYVAFLMFAIIMGVAVGVFYDRGRMVLLGITAFVGILLCIYTPFSQRQWQGRIWNPSERKSISSLKGLYGNEYYGFEMDVYDVLQRDKKKNLTIVECSGNSYTHEDAVSVYSGAQTVVGWFVHEWLWHDSAEAVSERRAQVEYFYESGDKEYCRTFLKKYDVDYIVVGLSEVCKYYVDESGFADYGDTILTTECMEAELKLIRVDKQRL